MYTKHELILLCMASSCVIVCGQIQLRTPSNGYDNNESIHITSTNPIALALSLF